METAHTHFRTANVVTHCMMIVANRFSIRMLLSITNVPKNPAVTK